MGFGERLYNIRNKKNMTREELAQILNCSPKTVAAYENGQNTPSYDTFINICNIFKRDANYFMQDGLNYMEFKLNPEDEKLISGYKSISDHDKAIVDYILSMEKMNIKPIIKYENIVADDVIAFPLVKQKASAGIGDPTHQWSNEIDKVCFPKNIVPKGTTHAIIVDGFSMEPQFFNGQIVFINAEKDCNDGEYGIFQVITDEETDIYCKQLKYDEYGHRYLHSVSERADDPEFTEQEGVILKCIGKIIV